MSRLYRVEVPYISSGTRAQTSGEDGKYLFGKAVYPPGGRCGPRTQAVYQLIVLIEGSLHLSVDDARYDLVPGDAILLRPGGRELFRFSPEAQSIHSWCQVSPGSLTAKDRRLLRRASGVHRSTSTIHLLIAEGLAVQNHANAELHDAMATLAKACLLRFAAHASSIDRHNTATPLHPALQRAHEIASMQYAELHSSEDLAKRVGVSSSRLRSLCRTAQGESPSAMIWRLKVEHATQLIRSTGLTLGEIADDCGFANPFHLSRAVRRHTGYSPRRLRQNEWGR
jgi:AraC-like DNA-binding protein